MEEAFIADLYNRYYPNGTPAELDNSSCMTLEPPSGQNEVFYAIGWIYPIIFVTAVTGNMLVLYVVTTNREMQTVTNVFIANLAASDLLVNFSSLWLTPTYIFINRWIWGRFMCHALPLCQGIATYNSTFTLMAIALDRYMVIIHPLRPRISKSVAFAVIVSIWTLSMFLTFPYAYNMVVVLRNTLHANRDQALLCNDPELCLEMWPYDGLRTIYGTVAMALQFIIPFLISAICYIRIWQRISNRGGMAQVSNVDAEAMRKRRLLKMLIAMVLIFALSWLPVNCLNVYRDLQFPADPGRFIQRNFNAIFLFAHVICMSGTCWNPILFAWLNENFQREFKAVLPCFPAQRTRLNRPFSIRGNPRKNNKKILQPTASDVGR